MQEIRGKNILIAGFGAEGKSTLSFLQKNHRGLTISVADKNPPAIKGLKLRSYSGEGYLNQINQFDTIIRTPGIPLELFRGAKHVTSHTNIFFENCTGRVIAITGTKGKSTTATLVYKLLESKEKDVRLVGNIGIPALDSLKGSDKDTIFVLEISSFQLEDIRYSPHIAVILAVTSDHLDRHGSQEKYVKAKKNIIRFQSKSDYVFFNSEDKYASKIAKSSKAKQIPVHSIKVPYGSSLIGRGNEINIAMASAVARHFEISEKNIKKVILGFKPLPHRIEKVGTYRGVTFYDDSIATNPSASLNGINALIDNLETVIIGGANKGFDYSEYVKQVSLLNIKNIILMPDTGYEMKDKFEKFAKNSNILKAPTMEEAVRLAYKNTSKGKSCLLSPAATSFNMFTDYKERGDAFQKYVKSG